MSNIARASDLIDSCAARDREPHAPRRVRLRRTGSGREKAEREKIGDAAAKRRDDADRPERGLRKADERGNDSSPDYGHHHESRDFICLRREPLDGKSHAHPEAVRREKRHERDDREKCDRRRNKRYRRRRGEAEPHTPREALRRGDPETFAKTIAPANAATVFATK